MPEGVQEVSKQAQTHSIKSVTYCKAKSIDGKFRVVAGEDPVSLLVSEGTAGTLCRLKSDGGAENDAR
jgi:hypothetical protein